MILQSLYNYYQILLKDKTLTLTIPESGYRSENISYVLNLSSKGELLDILPLTSKIPGRKKDREAKYRVMRVPERVKRSGTDPKPNFIWDNSAFVLGIPEKKGKDTQYGARRFEAFRQHNIEILSRADSENAQAVIAFLQEHDPRKSSKHPVISRHLEGLLEGGYLIFQVQGKNVLDDPEIKRAWEEYQLGRNAVKMQCLVTGKTEPIARLHPDIKGVRGTRQNRASLVSFNLPAFESYGLTQGLNSPVSQRVASGYGVVLDYLLSAQNPNRPIYLGDTAVVYWAESPDTRYPNAFATLINPAYLDAESEDIQRSRREAEAKLGSVAPRIEKAQALDPQGLTKGLDKETRFFVLGIAPNAPTNASRLAIRFFLTEPFGKFVERIMLHYDDLKIQKEFANQPDYISPYHILAECVSPKVTRRDEELRSSWGLLGGALMRSILTGAPYPEGLYAAIINRIRHDSDEEGKSRKINYVRAAFIKAHLLRKYRRQAQNPYQEVLQMSLNEQFTHPAYVLGRLFAVLEKAQKEAIPEAGATIKDRYFTSACATPASVFPTLLRLSHHHTAKAEYGYVSDRRIQDLLDLLEAKPFPTRLTLDEQGVFVLGYYHQRAAFYVKNSDTTAETESETK